MFQDNDYIGIGFGQPLKSTSTVGGGTAGDDALSPFLWELTYSFKVNDGVTVIPAIFGGTDIQRQVMSGNIDEYASIRMRQGDTRIGESAAMPPDLDASYLKLNLPGSPLPANGLLAPQNVNAAEATQKMIMSEEQMFLAQYLPAAGLSQLPVGQPPLESGKGKK